MTSYFTKSRAAGGLLAAFFLMGGASCKQVKIEDTSAEFTRSAQTACTDSTGDSSWPGSVQTKTMDTYVVQVLELTDPAGDAHDPLACEKCVNSSLGCKVLHEECLCGGAATASPTQLRTVLSGTRLGALDYEDLYCLRVLAIDRSSLDGDAPRSCACSSAWTAPASSPSTARLCALSAPYSAGPLNFTLDVQCPGDGRSFSTCIGAAAPM